MPYLLAVLEQCAQSAYEISELVSATYFTHSGETERSVGM